MKDEEIKLEEIEVSHTLGGAGKSFFWGRFSVYVVCPGRQIYS